MKILVCLHALQIKRYIAHLRSWLEMPIYMEAIMTILREMEHNFDYDLFCKKMKNLKLKSDQRTMLDLRLSLLNSCVKKGNSTKRVSSRFKKGQLTIVEYATCWNMSDDALM